MNLNKNTPSKIKIIAHLQPKNKKINNCDKRKSNKSKDNSNNKIRIRSQKYSIDATQIFIYYKKREDFH